MDLSNSATGERAICFPRMGHRGRGVALEDAELLAVRRVPFPDAVGMVERGEIRDAMERRRDPEGSGLA
jgi:hypothetical protein